MTDPDASALFHAFLSYHSGDAGWVAQLKSALEARGLRVWLDREQLRPGDRFPGALASAIGSIGCVVLILSRGSLASAWVEEEYTLALTRGCRVVPVLIDDVEPPGFLSGRTWVDFRDPARFTASLDELVFGVTGRRPEGTPVPEPPAFREATGSGGDEGTILRGLIARRRSEERRLRQTRIVGGILGGTLGGVFFVATAGAPVEFRLLYLVLAGSIPPAAGWGVTARGLSRLNLKLEQFEVLHDGLEACRSRSHPGCVKLRQHFWDMMAKNAAEATLDTGRAG